jgi:hypothetical protein
MRAVACAFAALTAMCVSHPADARDTGIINQAGVYEQTMKFYLHPAHLYWSSEAPQPMSQHPAVLVKQKPPADDTAMTAIWPHPGLTRKGQQQNFMKTVGQR